MVEVIYHGGKYQITLNKSKTMQLTLPESHILRGFLPLKIQGGWLENLILRETRRLWGKLIWPKLSTANLPRLVVEPTPLKNMARQIGSFLQGSG